MTQVLFIKWGPLLHRQNVPKSCIDLAIVCDMCVIICAVCIGKLDDYVPRLCLFICDRIGLIPTNCVMHRRKCKGYQ